MYIASLLLANLSNYWNGSEYVSIFMKQVYNQNMTMQQAAELGYFAIKYFEDFQLTMTVGVNDGYRKYGSCLMMNVMSTTKKEIIRLREKILKLMKY